MDRSTTATEWGVTNYLWQLRENPALAKAQTSSTGKRWVKSVFNDLTAPARDVQPLPLGTGPDAWSDTLGDLIQEDPAFDGDAMMWD